MSSLDMIPQCVIDEELKRTDLKIAEIESKLNSSDDWELPPACGLEPEECESCQ